MVGLTSRFTFIVVLEDMGLIGGFVGGEEGVVSSFTALRIPLATFKKASSRFDQRVTALPSEGRALSLPNRALFQSDGRRRIGIIRASPLSCRSIAHFISML